VIGTLATIQSGAYEDAIRRRNPEATSRKSQIIVPSSWLCRIKAREAGCGA